MIRHLLLLTCLFTLLFFVDAHPVYADDCSGPDDCASVIQGSGIWAALLSVVLGASAAAKKRAQRNKLRNPQRRQNYAKAAQRCREIAKELREFADGLEKVFGSDFPEDLETAKHARKIADLYDDTATTYERWSRE